MNPIMLTTGEIRFDTFLEKSVGNGVPVGGAAERQRRNPTSRVSTVANLNDGPVCGDTPVMIWAVCRRKRLLFGLFVPVFIHSKVSYGTFGNASSCNRSSMCDQRKGPD